MVIISGRVEAGRQAGKKAGLREDYHEGDEKRSTQA